MKLQTSANYCTSSLRRDGTYTIDGVAYPSITTLLGQLDKPALLGWAARTVAETVASLVGQAEEERWAWKKIRSTLTDVTALASVPMQKRDERGAGGSAVHKAIERFTYGEKPSPSDEARPYYTQFEHWCSLHEPTFITAEAAGVNRAIGYACTRDMSCLIDGETWMIDYKTGKAVYPESRLQLAAQAAVDSLVLKDGSLHPAEPVDRVGILLLKPEGYEFHEWILDGTELEVVKALVAIYHDRQKEVKSVVQQ